VSAPDALTLVRAVAGVPIGVAILAGQREIALALFIVAALSDALDGALARRLGVVTERGALLDPLADKILVVSTLAALWLVGDVPLWLFGIVAAREVTVGALRAGAHAVGESRPAGVLAKVKTVCEMLGLAAVLLGSIAGTTLLVAAAAIALATLPLYVTPFRRRFT